MEQGSASLRKALHDLKQPLNVIRLASGNIGDRLSQKIGRDEWEYLSGKLQRIDEQTLRAARQIDALLNSIESVSIEVAEEASPSPTGEGI